MLAVVAHEIAHVVCGHRLYTKTPDEYQQQEQEAWQRICTWGFKREEAQHRAMWKRRHTREQALIRKLSAPAGASQRPDG
jgi:hypothetical protein